jgi:hypothetical protein
MADRATEIAETAQLARQAVALGKDDAVALSMGGVALVQVVGEVEDGAAFIEQALILNPNLAAGWLTSGWVNLVHSIRLHRNWRRSYVRRPL